MRVHEDPRSGKFPTFRKSIDTVQLKKMSRRSPDCGEANNVNIVHSEVFSPGMDARMKKRRKLTRRGV